MITTITSTIREHVVKRFHRSSYWPNIRKKHLRKFPFCAICKKRRFLQVHHIESFHEHPEMELFSHNLITLCAKHHFIYGHCENWRYANKYLRKYLLALRDMYSDKNHTLKKKKEKHNDNR